MLQAGYKVVGKVEGELVTMWYMVVSMTTPSNPCCHAVKHIHTAKDNLVSQNNVICVIKLKILT